MEEFKGLNLNAEYNDIRFVYESYIKLRKEDMLSSDDLLKIHELYSENKEDFARAILDTTLFQKMQNADSCIPTDREDVERYVPAFSKILDETLQEQGRRFGSFNLIYEGWYSNIFQIGNKILKVGVPRRTYEIPNHKRILQPFIRENFETKEGKPFACIELSQAVTAQKIMNYTVLYNIYKELRESGIVWGDAKAENIGILNDVNLPRYEKQLFQNIPEFVGIKGENKDAPLDIGDYVIIDTDFLYELDSNKKIEKDSGIYLLSHSENFETMYQTELKYKVRVNQYKNDEGR